MNKETQHNLDECPKCESANMSGLWLDESYEQITDSCNDCGWESEPRNIND